MKLPDRELIPLIRGAFERGQNVRMMVTGSSMRPFIMDGDAVELEDIQRLPQPGQIVQVQMNETKCIMHRVVRIEGQIYHLRGDAHWHSEGPFTTQQLLGRVVTSRHNHKIRNHKHGIWAISGWIWMTVHPAGLYLVKGVRGLRKLGNILTGLIKKSP
ncbi:MAG: S24/S26 family peptidase [Anaerolineae bacterium]|nr:S24/S26 family peptidase [Anaerolineae bacterium]